MALPKTLAALHPNRIAVPSAYVYVPLLKIFYPLVWLINAIANGILLSAWTRRSVELPLDSAAYQEALDARLVNSSLREKAGIKANIDMEASYR